MRRWGFSGLDNDPTLLNTLDFQDDQHGQGQYQGQQRQQRQQRQQEQNRSEQQQQLQVTDIDDWTTNVLADWAGYEFGESLPDANVLDIDIDQHQPQDQRQTQPQPQLSEDAALFSFLQPLQQSQPRDRVSSQLAGSYDERETPTTITTTTNTTTTATTTPSSQSETTPRLVSFHGASAGVGQVVPPKVGTRFSRESLRILRNWLAAHSARPFPTDEEREMLQRQTGLTKTQILNWMANARRRGKMAERSRTDSPRTRSPSPSRPADIPPQRAGTPAPHMKPLDRWVDSPPENEPAAVAAIARAVQESSSSAGPSSRRSSGDGSSDRNYRPSPSSSVGGTSLSSGASGYSFDSRDSKGSVGAVPRRHHGLRSARRRRKPGDRGTHRDKNPGKSGTKTPLVAPINTFQCTFCTETFSSKHTWQRHEKSLHLPLERWVCAPKGPRALDVTGTKSTCAFCDLLDPGDEHISMHNYAVCHQRNLEERTFHRKDHLGQHLRLVHNLAPDVVGRRLAQWKMDTPTIRSVCGFCSTSLDSWEARADHLAEHFKMGNTMADWKGDWGFEPHILARLEDSLAPYMIAQERTAPFPFAASKTPVESPRSAYELIKLELLIFVDMYYDRTGRIPSSDELQFDACRVIFTAEVPSYSREQEEHPSWLRDLVFSSDSVVRKARLNPLRPAAESRLSFLGVIGKKGPFDSCPLEAQLVEFVEERRRQGADEITPHQLQAEACRLMHLADRLWPSAPADIPATWLMGLAKSCTGWLDLFRVRVGLIPPFERPERPTPCIMDTSALDSVLNNYNILDDKLIRRMEARSMDPTNSELRQQMLSCIMSEFDDETDAEWKRAAAANDAWLARFKRRHFAWSGMYTPPAYEQDASLHAAAAAAASSSSPSVLVAQGSSQYQPLASTAANMTACGNIERILKAPYFLNEPNFDRWVPRELARWVAATMSPNNPNQHVPTDEELQNQSRWIMYEDNDPFNQTAADNIEWLSRFKRDVGILNDFGPGLNNEMLYMPRANLSDMFG